MTVSVTARVLRVSRAQHCIKLVNPLAYLMHKLMHHGRHGMHMLGMHNLLHPPLALVGVSIATTRERRHNDCSRRRLGCSRDSHLDAERGALQRACVVQTHRCGTPLSGWSNENMGHQSAGGHTKTWGHHFAGGDSSRVSRIRVDGTTPRRATRDRSEDAQPKR